MKRAFSALPALLLTAGLAGCATSWVVDSDVKSFSSLGTVAPGATYRFDRLPSQQADGARQESLEAMAGAALDKAGLRRDDARPQYTAQIGARVTAGLSPWADPWLYNGPWGYGYGGYGYYGRRWYGGGWYGGPGLRAAGQPLVRARSERGAARGRLQPRGVRDPRAQRRALYLERGHPAGDVRGGAAGLSEPAAGRAPGESRAVADGAQVTPGTVPANGAPRIPRMEEPTRLIAVRHGETAWNLDTRIQGHIDIALNDTGLWQAQRAGEALADEPIGVVYASDLARAWQTAEAIARPHGLAVQAEPRLRERAFGTFEGMSFAEIEATLPEQAKRWRERDPEFEPEGGESLLVFRDRVTGVAAELAARHPGELVVLVAHGGVMDVLYRAATRQELQAPRTWQLGNAAINRMLWTPEGFSLVGWSDTAHLAAGKPLDEITS
jgi:probable phosphoglycerate mutase